MPDQSNARLITAVNELNQAAHDAGADFYLNLRFDNIKQIIRTAEISLSSIEHDIWEMRKRDQGN